MRRSTADEVVSSKERGLQRASVFKLFSDNSYTGFRLLDQHDFSLSVHTWIDETRPMCTDGEAATTLEKKRRERRSVKKIPGTEDWKIGIFPSASKLLIGQIDRS